jgi:flagellar basal body rod protein FlgG
MLRGLYAAASALDSAQTAHQVTAANLANATVPGYRQQGVRFQTLDLAFGRDTPPPGDPTGTQLVSTYTDFRPAALQLTGHPYDLAVGEPDQFFVVQGPDGPMYTRNGTFRVSPQGEVFTQSGYPLLGTAGPVRVPANTAGVTVASDGNVSADGVPTGRVRLVRFPDPARLTPVGPTHFAAPPDAPPQEAVGRVLQGYREGSNVNSAEAMVSMVAATRYYEAAQRALRTIGESVQLSTRPQS